MTNAQKAAEEIAIKYLAEPCREVDDDGEVCAWSVDPDVIADIAEIIEKHCGDSEKVLQAAAKWAGEKCTCPTHSDHNCAICFVEHKRNAKKNVQCWIEFWRKEARECMP